MEKVEITKTKDGKFYEVRISDSPNVFMSRNYTKAVKKALNLQEENYLDIDNLGEIFEYQKTKKASTKKPRYKYSTKHKKHPDPMSNEFVDFLLKNNEVLDATGYWTVIKNCKYPDGHITVFSVEPVADLKDISPASFKSLQEVLASFKNHFFYINDKKNKTIKRFHFHLVKNRDSVIDIFSSN